jgi:zinc transport system substrate-binding protein
MKNKFIIFSFIFGLSLFLSGCSEDNSNSDSLDNNKLTVFTTIYPLADFTARIGGDYVSVESVYPPGADAHTFEPTAKTMTHIADADAFIYTGVGLEGFVESAIKTLNNEKVTLINAGEGIQLGVNTHEEEEFTSNESTDEEHAHDEHAHSDDEHPNEESLDVHNHGDTDPHVWIDPILSIVLAENIKNSLVALQPELNEVFEQNFEDLKTELLALDQEFHDMVSSSTNQEILVSHAAYGYWEKRYGIEQISVSGLSPTQEPSQKQLQTIIETAKAHKIEYVIFEQNVTGNIAEVVQNEIGAKPLYLHNLESLTDEDIDNQEDYFSIMRKNIETLKKAIN